jgi:hypothetical protein
VIWEHFDYDDGFDPNVEYVAPAIAMGIIGRVVKVVYPGETVPTGPEKIAFKLNRYGNIDYLSSAGRQNGIWPLDQQLKVGLGETLIEVPLLWREIALVLAGGRRDLGESLIMMGSNGEIPVPFTREQIAVAVEPDLIS